MPRCSAFDHPSSEQLAAWLDGELPANEYDQVTAHLTRCEECWLIADTVRDTLAQFAAYGFLDEYEGL